MPNWKKQFDKKFTRKNAVTKEYEDKWFIHDYITAKEMKQFIQEKIDEAVQAETKRLGGTIQKMCKRERVAKDKYYKMGQEAERERIYEEKLNLIL